MQRQHTGRPGTTVIPDDWATAPAAVITNALGAAAIVTIGPEGGVTAWNEGSGQMETAAADAVYTGAASIMAVSDTARILTVVADPTSTRVMDVMLPRDAEGVDLVQVDHVITVTACDDAQLIGKTLAVSGIERGSQRFSRVLLAVLND